MTDLTYKTTGLFTTFYAETEAGEDAWRVIAKENEGNAKIFTIHLDRVLYDLRNAGYVVNEGRNRVMPIGKILKELEELGL